MSISPELLAMLHERGDSWRCYETILRYIRGAIDRVPTKEVLEICNEDEIDLILGKETGASCHRHY